MDENIKTKIEKWTQEDGRRAERRIMETEFNNEGQAERVTEVHIEDLRPLKLQQRIVEKIKPVIYERKVETIDPSTGKVVEKKVESIEPRVPMQLVEHIGLFEQNRAADAPAPVVPVAPENSSNVDPEYLKHNKELQTLVEILKNNQNSSNSEFETKLKSLGMAAQVAKKSKDNFWNDKFLMVVIIGQVIALGYVLFFM